MKILYTICVSTYGGAPKHVLDLASSLQKKGHDCYIVCPKGEMVCEYRKVGLKVITLDLKSGIDPFYILRLRRILIREKIDILHTHLLKSTVNGLLAGFLARTRVKIAHIHGTLFDWEVSLVKRRLNIWVNSLVTNLLADKVVALTEVVKKNLINNDKIRKEKIVVIPNGIDGAALKKIGERGFLFKKYAWDEEKIKIVGSVSRLTVERGQKYLIEAAEIIIRQFNRPEIRFVLIGDGELREQLEDEVREKELGQYVKFAGFLSEDDKNKAMVDFNVFVSSAIREGFGLSVLQAMFAKIPLVVSDLEVYNELCPNGECSLQVESGNPNDFAEKILAVLRDKALQAKLVLLAYERASKNFSLEKFIHNYLTLYEKQLKEKQ